MLWLLFGGCPLEGLCVSIVTLAEIRFGIEVASDAVRRSALNDWLTLTVRPMFDQRVLPITEEIMRRELSWGDPHAVGCVLPLGVLNNWSKNEWLACFGRRGMRAKREGPTGPIRPSRDNRQQRIT